MHPVAVQIHSFYVPNRILWSGWEDFITGDSATPPPTLSGAAHVRGSLKDYLGAYDDASVDMSVLPVRAYNKIFNEYYRDQDLVTEVSEDSTAIQFAAWEKDRFTAARPWPQKGTAVTLPIGTEAPVLGIGKDDQTYSGSGTLYESDGAQHTYGAGEIAQVNTNVFMAEKGTTGYPNVRADLSSATGVDIREFREALAVQRYQEARARYGSEYVDYLRYCGVRPSDARLQRPEFLAGGRQWVAFSEVIQTSYDATNTEPIGQLYGHGLAAMRSNRFTRFFEEHGWMLSLMVVRPRALYGNGFPRKFTKTEKEDYFQKELQDVGHEEIYNQEIYSGHTNPAGTAGIFGYGPRYSDYMFEENRVSGEFRDSLSNDWHLGRLFSSDMALNADFIKCDPNKRIFADQTNHHLKVMARNHIIARRHVRRSDVGRVI
jgi:hypothetical protein